MIPTYDRREMVTAAVASVLTQSEPDLELIVVDDGSTDGTAADLRRRFGRDARLRVLEKPNGGTGCARNHGVRHAAAPWVGFLDSDDHWRPDWIASQLARAEAHPEADLVLCDASYEGDWKHSGTVFSRGSWRTPDSIDAMLDGAWALPSCMLLRTAVARAVPFDPEHRFAEDTAFLFAFHAAGHVLVENPRVLTIYNRHAGKGADQKVDRPADHLRVMLDLTERYADRGRDPDHVRYRLLRRRARYYAAVGRWSEARPAARAWLRARPASGAAWRMFWRTVFRHGSKPL